MSWIKDKIEHISYLLCYFDQEAQMQKKNFRIKYLFLAAKENHYATKKISK